ncbi:MAG: FecR domain-containing protein [Ignavibacteriae bacterium]|nr:FecR domain-containing protein [Ignavibacteriota bacterium]
MKRTLIDRMWGWWKGEPRGHAAEQGIDRLIHSEAERLGTIDPDTHRRWLMLRNTITAVPEPRQTPATRIPARIIRPALVTGILASAAMMVFLLWRSTPVLDQTFATGRGQMSTITLADSSDVILNHTSEVLVAAMEPGKVRTVRLHGEAFFKVRKNGSPFQVITPAGSVEVLGTEFNVRERPGAFEVAVLSGKVRVRVPYRDGDRSVELTKGMVVLIAEGDTSCAAREIRYATYPGWMHNRLIFQDTPLASVCEELEARFDVRVRVSRSGAGRERISGTLESRTADQALASLATLTGLSLRHETDAFILY